MSSKPCSTWMGCYCCLVLLLLLGSHTNVLHARTLQEDAQQTPAAAVPPAATAPAAPSPANSSNATLSSINSTAAGQEDVAVDAGSAFKKMLQKTFNNQTMKDIPWKEMFKHHRGNGTHNSTLPKLKDLMPKNFSMKAVVQNVVNNITNGMTAMEFAKALMTGTISSNTADTNTPDMGLADVQSGAININPFVDGAALSNALTLAGRDATANSKGIVLGMIGTGRSSSQATALGMTNAKASTDTITINGGGFSQNSMGSNLAATPMGRADTSVRSAAFNVIGHTATGGLTTAFGKKGAASAGLGAGMTGLGESYSSQFADSISAGDTSSNVGVIAGTLAGAAKGTVGSVSVSSKKSAQSQALSTAKSALGSATSKSASLSTAAQNATSHVSSVATTGVGNVDAISSATSTGMNAKASADSSSTSQAGASNSRSHSKAVGVTSAESHSTASSHPFASGIRDTPVLWTQRKRPSTTWTTSRSSSNTARVGTSSWSGFNPFSRFVPAFMQHMGSHSTGEAPTTVPLLGEALVSSAALKALLPAVPKIHPQLPTFNQTIQINGSAQECNETLINFNRTADQPRLFCNATNNGTNSSIEDAAKKGALPSIGFFKGLQDMNDKFVAETKDGKNKTKPNGGPSLAAKLSALPGGGRSSKDAVDPFAAWTQQRKGAAAAAKPPDKAVAAKLAAVKADAGGQQVGKQRHKAPIGPQRFKAPIGPQRPPGLSSNSSSSSGGGGSSSSGGSSGSDSGQVATAAKQPAQ